MTWASFRCRFPISSFAFLLKTTASTNEATSSWEIVPLIKLCSACSPESGLGSAGTCTLDPLGCLSGRQSTESGAEDERQRTTMRTGKALADRWARCLFSLATRPSEVVQNPSYFQVAIKYIEAIQYLLQLRFTWRRRHLNGARMMPREGARSTLRELGFHAAYGPRVASHNQRRDRLNQQTFPNSRLLSQRIRSHLSCSLRSLISTRGTLWHSTGPTLRMHCRL